MSDKEKFNSMVQDAKIKAERQSELLDSIDESVYNEDASNNITHRDVSAGFYNGTLGAFSICMN